MLIMQSYTYRQPYGTLYATNDIAILLQWYYSTVAVLSMNEQSTS
jgi:hypothetical protein